MSKNKEYYEVWGGFVGEHKTLGKFPTLKDAEFFARTTGTIYGILNIDAHGGIDGHEDGASVAHVER